MATQAMASAPDSAASDAPDLVLREVTFARLVDGKIAGSGVAREVRYRRAGGRYEASQAQGHVLPGPGAEALQSLGEVRLSAPEVRGEMIERRTRALGGVEVVAARGDTARTNSALVDGFAGTIQGDEPVQARGPGYTLRGARFLARTDGTRIVLRGGAGGTLTPAAAPPAAAPPAAASRVRGGVR